MRFPEAGDGGWGHLSGRAGGDTSWKQERQWVCAQVQERAHGGKEEVRPEVTVTELHRLGGARGTAGLC